jgi:hypothetical protein
MGQQRAMEAGMAMDAAMRNLVSRALRQHAAGARAAVAAADAVHGRREAELGRLAQGMAREQACVPGLGAAAALLMADGAWRRAAAGRLEAAHQAARQAAEDCAAARAALEGTARRARGFDVLMARQDAARARQAVLRDPLGELMVVARLPGVGTGGGGAG